MARIVYDSDANRLTASIFRSLRYRGFNDIVDEAQRQIARMESGVLTTIEHARVAIAEGDYEKAIQILFRDPENSSQFIDPGPQWASEVSRLSSSQRPPYGVVIRMALDQLMPRGQLFLKTPINVIQAVTTLCDIIVLPTLCFRYTQSYFNLQHLTVQIATDDGVEFAGFSTDEDCSPVRAFWVLFNEIVSSWHLEWLCTDQPIELPRERITFADHIRYAAIPVNEIYKLEMEMAA